MLDPTPDLSPPQGLVSVGEVRWRRHHLLRVHIALAAPHPLCATCSPLVLFSFLRRWLAIGVFEPVWLAHLPYLVVTWHFWGLQGKLLAFVPTDDPAGPGGWELVTIDAASGKVLKIRHVPA